MGAVESSVQTENADLYRSMVRAYGRNLPLDILVSLRGSNLLAGESSYARSMFADNTLPLFRNVSGAGRTKTMEYF